MTKKAPSEDAVFHRLRGAIRSRQLSPGTRLREARLCEIMGASRGKVRKALARLAHEGLIELTPNRGAAVARPTAQEAADLFAARKCIEVAIARLAAGRVTPSALAGLRAHLDLEQQARARGDADAVVLLSGEFHVLLAEIAGNSALKRYLEDIVLRESLIIQLYERAPGNCSVDEHARIVEALESADADLVAARIEAHVDTIAASLDLGRQPKQARSLEEILSAE